MQIRELDVFSDPRLAALKASKGRDQSEDSDRKVRGSSDIEYLSPSSLVCFEWDRDEYVRRYFARVRDKQTIPMGVGSAFDALVKQELTGVDWSNQVDKPIPDPLTGAVDTTVYDGIWEKGHEIWEWYKRVGGYALLCREIGESEVICEDTITLDIPEGWFGYISDPDGNRKRLRIQGKPDLMYLNAGKRVILDWKVNGVCGKGRSPSPGYIDSLPKSRIHKSAEPMLVGKMMLDMGSEKISRREWGTQLGTYHMLMGIIDSLSSGWGEVEQGIARVHQITMSTKREYGLYIHGWFEDGSAIEKCKGGFGAPGQFCSPRKGNGGVEEIGLIGRYISMWNMIQEDWIYKDAGLSLEESRDRARMIVDGCIEGDYDTLMAGM